MTFIHSFYCINASNWNAEFQSFVLNYEPDEIISQQTVTTWHDELKTVTFATVIIYRKKETK